MKGVRGAHMAAKLGVRDDVDVTINRLQETVEAGAKVLEPAQANAFLESVPKIWEEIQAQHTERQQQMSAWKKKTRQRDNNATARPARHNEHARRLTS